jgi:hypothetical protein
LGAIPEAGEVNVLNQQKKLQRILLIAALIVLGWCIATSHHNFVQKLPAKTKAYEQLTRANALTEEQRDETNKA